MTGAMNTPYDALFRHFFVRAWSRQRVFARRLGTTVPELDLTQGTLNFRRRGPLPVELLGTYDEATTTWTYGWADQSAQSLPNTVLGASRDLKKVGDEAGIPEFSIARFRAPEIDCSKIAMVVARILGFGCYYRASVPGASIYVMVPEDADLAAPTPPADIPAVLGEAAAATEHPAAPLAHGFFSEEGFEVTGDDRAMVATKDNVAFLVRTDRAGRLREVRPVAPGTSPPEPEEPRSPNGILSRVLKRG